MTFKRYYLGASVFCLSVGLAAIHFTNGFGTAQDAAKKVEACCEGGLNVGTVTMWWGAKNAVPAGWEICDGSPAKSAGATLVGNKPNLVDRFPKGALASRMNVADLSQAVGGNNNMPALRIDTIQGLKVIEDGAHKHEGAHTHPPLKGSAKSTDESASASGNDSSDDSESSKIIQAKDTKGGEQPSNKQQEAPANSEGAHSHALAGFIGSERGVNADGDDKTGANQPAFSELFFIIRVK